jgi:hypothetical protein
MANRKWNWDLGQSVAVFGVCGSLITAACDGGSDNVSHAASHHDGGARKDAGVNRDAATADASRATQSANDAAIASGPTAIGKACASDGDCSDSAGATCAKSFLQFRAVDSAPGGYCSMPCTASAECGTGSACVGARFGNPGHCSIGCDHDGDCRNGYYCAALAMMADAGAVAATCQPHPQTDDLADGIVGAGCKKDADCGTGTCLLQERITSATYPGGYCTGSCVEDVECGAGGVCSPGFLGAVGVCYLGCEHDGDCGRDGYRCREVAGDHVCVPGPKPLPDHLAGAACKDDQDCGGGPMTCASDVAGVPAQGGYCTQSCALDDDCGAGGTCISGVDIVVLSTGSCVQSCVPPNGCREGYVCRSLSGATNDTHGVCVPDASDGGAQ